MAQDAAAVAGRLGSAGAPWLAIEMSGPGGLALSAGDALVIDIADQHAAPVAVNPFEPAAGYPIQAHADRLAGLFEAAFGLAEPVVTAVKAGLARTYADCGWDVRTGTAPPGAVTVPAVPAFRQLRAAVIAAAADLGYSPGMQAAVRGFVATRLDALWAGPTGRFLEGGHPADVRSLLTGNVLVANSGVADDQAVSFLAGVLLVRIAEELRDRDASRCTVIVGTAGALSERLAQTPGAPAAAGWFGRLLADIRSQGADVVVAPGRPAITSSGAERAGGGPTLQRAGRPDGAGCPDAGAADEPSPAVLLGRRSAACGERCGVRPCSGYELHAAELLARDDGLAWLRLWVQALVLAFLTGRPVPQVPAPLRPGWLALSPRRRECVLATVIGEVVTARAAVLRHSYEPRRLMAVLATLAARMLAAATLDEVPPSAGLPFRAGHAWVIPQLRWLHEIERVSPLARDTIRLDDIAPPLDFGLTGLADWPGIRVRDRLSGLRRHPLSTESGRNRDAATVALLGDGGRAGFDADLAIAGMGLSPLLRLRHAARVMGAGGSGQEPGWLEAVLSWPDRIIRPAWNSDVRRTATG
jgi:hypothetical protein